MNYKKIGWLVFVASGFLFLLAIAAPAQNPKEAKPAAQQVKAQRSSASSPAMTKDQGDAILDELRQIRQLLEKQQAANFRPQQPAPAPQVRTSMVVNEGSYSLGLKDAPVTLVEFSDYQCPYCRRFHAQTFAMLKKNYIDSGKVQFISRDLPLDFHVNAMPAAEAARCAGEQGKFWEMRDALLSNDTALNQDGIDQRAQSVSLDMARFHTCVAAAPYKVAILKEASDANALGIDGTPTFVLGKVVNGKLDGLRLVGGLSYERLQAAVEDVLKSGTTR